MSPIIRGDDSLLVVDPTIVKEIGGAVARICDKHGIPFHLLGPILVAMGNSYREHWAEQMVRAGLTVDQAREYLGKTRGQGVRMPKKGDGDGN